MAGVLAEFAREGRQALVFTEDREAVRRFESLGVEVRDIDAAAPSASRRSRGRRLRRRPRRSRRPCASFASRRPADHPSAIAPASAVVGDARDKPVFYLTVDASLADFPVLGNDTALVFSSLGIRTVEDLLAADAAEVARRLAHPAVTAEAVRLWQQHTSLMCFVPGVSLVDAQVLAACEIDSPEALFSIDVRLLADAIARFLATERGRRFASSRERFTRDRLALLQKHARRQRDRWQLLSPRYAWVERTAEPPKPRPAAKRSRAPRRNAAPHARRDAAHRPPHAQQRPLRFLLDRSSPVAEAPSIGRTTAERLAQVGIRTVADLLNANPESTAEELGDAPRRRRRRSPAGKARPGSRAAFPSCAAAAPKSSWPAVSPSPSRSPARASPSSWRKVRAVCRTTEGKRLLRGGEVPTSARVAGWIRHAAHTRPLEAA